MKLSVDQMIELAKTDPDKLEAYRQAEISRLMDAASPESRQRLEQTQWKIDAIRRRSKTPLKAALELHGWLMAHIREHYGPQLPQSRVPSPLPSAAVVRFPGKSD